MPRKPQDSVENLPFFFFFFFFRLFISFALKKLILKIVFSHAHKWVVSDVIL